MDYTELTKQFLSYMQQLRKSRHQKKIDETMHGEAFVIMFISRRGGNVSPSEISNTMGISSARIAAALNNLESKGLITRKNDPNDRRRIFVDLTKSGIDLAKSYEKKAFENSQQLLEFLGEQDAKELVRIVGRLAQRYSETDEVNQDRSYE